MSDARASVPIFWLISGQPYKIFAGNLRCAGQDGDGGYHILTTKYSIHIVPASVGDKPEALQKWAQGEFDKGNIPPFALHDAVLPSWENGKPYEPGEYIGSGWGRCLYGEEVGAYGITRRYFATKNGIFHINHEVGPTRDDVRSAFIDMVKKGLIRVDDLHPEGLSGASVPVEGDLKVATVSENEGRGGQGPTFTETPKKVVRENETFYISTKGGVRVSHYY